MRACTPQAVQESLEGSNMSSLLHEVGARMHATFLNHMQQFVFNGAGGCSGCVWAHGHHNYLGK